MTSVIVIVLLSTSLINVSVSNAATDTMESSFSIIWISDTQHLAKDNTAYFEKLCNWIVENNDTYNIKMVVHTGDIVSEGKKKQWSNANHSMGNLLENNMPYCWNAGNHDYINDPWIGNEYAAFNPEVMQEKQYWIGDFENGMNTAVNFSFSGWDCLIINLSYHASDASLDWANKLLDANPQAHAIVATHAYLKDSGGYDTWGYNFKDKVLDTHKNVFLTLNGHSHPTMGNWIRVDERDELLFDMQDAYEELGAASARILTFNIDKGTIRVQTYSAYTDQFIEESKSSLLINSSFRNSSAGQNSQNTWNLIVSILVIFFIITVALLVLLKFRYNKKL